MGGMSRGEWRWEQFGEGDVDGRREQFGEGDVGGRPRRYGGGDEEEVGTEAVRVT